MIGLIRLGKQVSQPIIMELAAMNTKVPIPNDFEERRWRLIFCLERILGFEVAYQHVAREAHRLQFRDEEGYNNLVFVLDKIADHGKLDVPWKPQRKPAGKK